MIPYYLSEKKKIHAKIMICMNGSKNPNINSKYYNKMFKADN